MTSSHTPDQSLLGKATPLPQRYDPALLFALPRAPNRAVLCLDAALPFHGVDIWNAYELSWLDARGKPVVALGEFRVPATSPNLIESKSFKLYLNSFNGERIDSAEEFRATLARDLSAVAESVVEVTVRAPARAAIEPLRGISIDAEALDMHDYGPPDAAHLRTNSGAGDVRETLVSDLLKSNCPVTGQPDWASVQIDYAGTAIDRAGLLRYLVSFRDHADFHENCVERIFVDVQRRCAPAELTVFARYTRRGGLDINPWRSNVRGVPSNPRTPRQ